MVSLPRRATTSTNSVSVSVSGCRADRAPHAESLPCERSLSDGWERCEAPSMGVAQAGLGVVLAEELRRLGWTLRKPGFLKDRRDLGVRGEALPARLVPVEDRPNPVALIWIPKDARPLAPVLLSLLSAFG